MAKVVLNVVFKFIPERRIDKALRGNALFKVELEVNRSLGWDLEPAILPWLEKPIQPW